MTRKILIAGAVIIFLILAASCGPVTPSGPNPATARAMTLYAVLTESAHNLNNPSPTLPAATNTSIPGIPTSTPTSAVTATSAVTQLPSVTPTSSLLPTPCYRAFFVKDVTIADYTVINPGATFVKPGVCKIQAAATGLPIPASSFSREHKWAAPPRRASVRWSPSGVKSTSASRWWPRPTPARIPAIGCCALRRAAGLGSATRAINPSGYSSQSRTGQPPRP